MTTKLKMLPVWVSPALRALIDQVGPVNAATRALIILGAEAAGFDLDGMEREVAGLLAEELALEVSERLRRILLQSHEVKVSQVGDGTHNDDGEESISQDLNLISATTSDPFNDIGVEV
jgi:hypothetical protein